MTVEYDNSNNFTGFGGNATATVAPVGTVRGAIGIVQQGTNDSDTVTGMTCGGVAMTRVGRFVGTNSEHTVIYVYFLGAGIPAGSLDFVATTNASAGKVTTGITLTAAADTEFNIATMVMDSASENDPRVNFAIGGIESFVCQAFTSGKSQVANISAKTNWVQQVIGDMGALVSGVHTYDIVGTADVECGYDNTGAADNAQIVGIAVNEVSGGGAVTTPISVGAVVTGVGSFSRDATYLRSLQSSAVGTASRTSLISKIFQATASGTASLIPGLLILLNLVAGVVGATSVTTGLTISRLFTATTNGVATALRAVTFGRSFSAGAVAAPTISRSNTFLKLLTSTASGAATYSRSATYLRSFTVVGTGTVISAIGALLTLAFSSIATGSASFSSASVIGRSFSAVAAATANMSKIIGKAIASSVTGSATTSLLSNYIRTFSSTATGTVTVNRLTTYLRLFTASPVGTVIASAAAVIGVSIVAVVNVIATPSLTKVIGKVMTATATGTPSIGKYIFRLFTMTVTGTSTQNEAYITAVLAAATVNAIASGTQTFVVGFVSLSTLIRTRMRNIARNITRVFKK